MLCNVCPVFFLLLLAELLALSLHLFACVKLSYLKHVAIKSMLDNLYLFV